jgi:hypothetical protein
LISFKLNLATVDCISAAASSGRGLCEKVFDEVFS